VVVAGSGIRLGVFAAFATRALPRDIASFTGRQAELDQLTGTLTKMAAHGGMVGIHALDGMAGIGKTTFAVHAAHRPPPASRTGRFSCRCTPTRKDSGRSIPHMRWPACC
jgi:hypothetical protein